MRAAFAVGLLALLGLGATSQHGGMNRIAMAQEAPVSQAIMLAAQESDHSKMPMGKGKKGQASEEASNMSGCSMAMGDMKGDSKGGMMGDKGMMGGMMGGQAMKGCPMMAQMQQGKGMSGCAGMGAKPTP